jgi:hypothetical protein
VAHHADLRRRYSCINGTPQHLPRHANRNRVVITGHPAWAVMRRTLKAEPRDCGRSLSVAPGSCPTAQPHTGAIQLVRRCAAVTRHRFAPTGRLRQGWRRERRPERDRSVALGFTGACVRPDRRS